MRHITLARLERWVWYLFLATIAWQTRGIFWQADLSFIEWRSISLYASDVLMLGMFGLALAQLVRDRAWRRPNRADGIDLALFGFFLAALISLRSTDQFTVSVYQLFRLLQYVILFVYVRYRAVKFSVDVGLVAFVLGALAQSWLAIGQYVLQHDVGIRWLGETLLNTHLPGVAVFYDLAGTKILRAYGTLPHPNVLAVYLFVALWALGYLYQKHRGWIFAAAGTIMLWALYLTFSRTMIAIGLASSAVYGIVRMRAHLRPILIWWAMASVVFLGMFWRQIGARALISSHEEAVQLRIYYAREALGSGAHSWLHINWTGIGLGNFVSWLHRIDPTQPAWAYQPAHNLYLLIYSETGVLGIAAFLVFLFLVLRQTIGELRWALLTMLAAFLLIALFDHFFWTLQQGRILFWIVAGLAVAHHGKQSHRTTSTDSR